MGIQNGFLYRFPCSRMVSNASCLSLNPPSPQAMLKTDLGVWDGQFSTLLGGKGARSQLHEKLYQVTVPTLMTRIVEKA